MFRRRLPLAVAVLATGLIAAQDPPANGKTDKKDEKADKSRAVKKPDPPTGQPLTLGQCLAIAEQRQPRLKAALLSLQAAEQGLQGLNSLGRIADRLSPDLPVRRQQSILGLRAAQAAVDQVRQETVHDVCLMYFSHVYARQSEQTASDVVENLETYYSVAKELLESGAPASQLKNLSRQTLYNLDAIIAEVRTLQIKALTGRRQSLAALKEAMGVGPECDFYPATAELPVMDGHATQQQVVACALARRPELTQAAAGADVFNLEPVAQGMIRLRPQVATLAAGTDLHSRGVPLAHRNGTYRPGAFPPEMPGSLVGKTDERVARACTLAAKQSALYETIVGLIRLDAENSFIEWDQSVERMRLSKVQFDNSRQALKEAESAATTRADPQLLVNAQAVAGRAQANYVEAVFENIKALIRLERVTAGAFPVNFPGR